MHHHESVFQLVFVKARNHLDSCDQEQVFLNVSEKVEKTLSFKGVHLMDFVVEHIDSIDNLLALFGNEILVQFKTGLVWDRVVCD